MNRRTALTAAAVLLAGIGTTGLAKFEEALPQGAEAMRVLARWREAVVLTHGQAAFDSYRDILEESARVFARSANQPDYSKREARLEQLWVKIVGEFQRDEWEAGR